MDKQPHIDPETVEQYSMGQLSGSELERCEEHLLVCDTCRSRVTEDDAYHSAMRGAARQTLREETPERSRLVFFRLAPMAAAALILIGIAVTTSRISLFNAAPAALVRMTATRGTAVAAKAPAARRLTLDLDVASLPEAQHYRVSAVDELGRMVWQGTAAASAGRVLASVPKLAPGTYFVRVYSPSGELLREYGLDAGSTH